MTTLMDEVNGLMKIIICRLFGPTRPTQIALPRVSGYIEQSFRHGLSNQKRLSIKIRELSFSDVKNHNMAI